MNYVLYGEEQYLLQESLTRIVRSHVPDANDLNKLVYDADTTDLDVILEDAMQDHSCLSCEFSKCGK